MPNEAAGEGFEPPSEVAPAAGFQDRCLQPLGHPAGCLILSAVGGGVVAVAHRVGGWHEVRHQPLGDGRRRRRLLDGGGHVDEPTVALVRPDREREVAHPQARVASLLAVAGRAAPVLRQEQRQPPSGGAEVVRLRVESAERWVVRDPS